MKYIVLETEEGMQLPIVFPEVLTHCFVAGAMQLAIDTLDPKKDLRPKQLDDLLARGSAKPVSAGFVTFDDAHCSGESESLGGLKSKEGADAGRIVLGDSVLLMPDLFVEATLMKLLGGRPE